MDVEIMPKLSRNVAEMLFRRRKTDSGENGERVERRLPAGSRGVRTGTAGPAIASIASAGRGRACVLP